MLAGSSIGAVYSSCFPDLGTKDALNRFGQIEPRVLFTANGYQYNGKGYDSLERIADLLSNHLFTRPTPCKSRDTLV